MTAFRLKAARLVEFDYKESRHRRPYRLLVTRQGPSANFAVLSVDGEPPTEDWGRWSEKAIADHGENITVLAEFPVALADLLPEGCTRFEFKNTKGRTRYAKRCPDTGRWDIAGFYEAPENTNAYLDLNGVQRGFSVDLSTVVPLTVHPQYVEERR